MTQQLPAFLPWTASKPHQKHIYIRARQSKANSIWPEEDSIRKGEVILSKYSYSLKSCHSSLKFLICESINRFTRCFKMTSDKSMWCHCSKLLPFLFLLFLFTTFSLSSSLDLLLRHFFKREKRFAMHYHLFLRIWSLILVSWFLMIRMIWKFTLRVLSNMLS